jgi:hypothetical protein
MTKPNRNKAFTATMNRLAERYGGIANDSGEIVAEVGTIRVTTSADLTEAVADLAPRTGPVYIATTNREAIRDALRAVEQTRVGLMQPNGDILRPSAEPKDS